MLSKEDILKLDDEEIHFYYEREVKRQAIAEMRQKLLNLTDVEEAKIIKFKGD